MIFWLIGLSGAGKSYIGRQLTQKLKAKQPVIFLDGDIIRQIVGDNLGYDLASRQISGWRICRLCHYLESQGVTVVCSVISLFQEHRDWMRTNTQKYFQIYIDVPLDELKRRDPKGLYAQFERGETQNLAGVDLPFSPPKDNDWTIENREPFNDLAPILDQIIQSAELNEENEEPIL